MSPRAGSTLWLLRHEMRLGYRERMGKRGAGAPAVWLPAFAAALLTLFAGVPLGFLLRRVEVTVTPAFTVIADLAVLVIFTLMLSQTLGAATTALYQRGDLDLLFSSPIAPRKVLTVRFLSIALGAFVGFAFLLGPVLIPIAVLGHWPWLAAFVVLGALALAASAAGLSLATALFALIGPRRTRTVSQVLAALIGAAFFLTLQARNLGGGNRAAFFGELMDAAARGRIRMLPGMDLPLRALLGEPAPLAILAGCGAAVFLLASAWLGRRFAADAAAAGGADAGAAPARGRRVGGFAAGLFAATVNKELRLLRRDAGLLSQVLLRVLYLLPLAFVVMRNAGRHVEFALPGGAAGLTFMAGQVAASLTWITVSAEEAPDLLASSPAPISTLWKAKLAASLMPLAILLVLPLAGLIVLSPAAGVAATGGCVAAAVASGLINIWYQKPGNRADFRRRRGASWFATIAQSVVGGLIAAATGLATVVSPWALVPAALAVIALLALRRTDAQIAQSLRAAA